MPEPGALPTAHRDPATDTAAERWRVALECAGDAAWDWNVVTDDLVRSEGYTRMLGFEPDAFGPSAAETDELVHPDDRARVAVLLRDHVEGRTPAYASEHRLRCRDGSYRWVLDRGRAVERDAGGRAVRIIGTHTDISQRKAHEAEIERLSRLYDALSRVNQLIARVTSREALLDAVCRALVESGGFTAVWVGRRDVASQRVEVVARHGDTTGYLEDIVISTADDPAGRGPTGTAVREDRVCICNDFLADPATLPWRARAERAGWRASAAIPIRVDGQVVGALTVYAVEPAFFGAREVALLEQAALDIGAGLEQLEREERRRHAERALRESEARYRMLFSHMTDALLLCELVRDEQGRAIDYRILAANDAVEEHTGFAAHLVLGHTIREFAANIADARLGVLESVVGTGTPARFTHFNAVLNRELDSLAYPVQGDQFAVLFRDVTRQREAEAEREAMRQRLAQSQKMESIGRLAGGVAHDFNNMLAVIQGYADLGLEQAGADSPLRHPFAEIRKAAERSADLTRQLLAFARQQAASPVVLDLNESVEATLKMLRRLIGENIGLAWLPGPALWPVRIDPAQLEEVLASLVVNGRDAIDGVGTVSIRTGNAVLDEAACAADPGLSPGEHVWLAVHDDGPGMDAEAMAHVFEPFYTTKTGRGSGLGLATVFGIVRQNDGTIRVESSADRGTTFTIHLPRATGLPASLAATLGPKCVGAGRETVLLVEDEAAILSLGRTILERLGYTVFTAATPEDAERVAGEHGDAIDLLLTDVVMPQMNGRMLAERISAAHPRMKTLFMSGYPTDIITRSGVLETGVHFLQKPFTPRALGAAVRERLDDPTS